MLSDHTGRTCPKRSCDGVCVTSQCVIMKRYVVLALSALMFGAAGVAVGTWIGWGSAQPLPNDEAVQKIIELVFKGHRATIVRRTPGTFESGGSVSVAEVLLGSDEYGPGAVVVHDVTATPGRDLDTGQAALSADGWRTSRPRPETLTAAK